MLALGIQGVEFSIIEDDLFPFSLYADIESVLSWFRPTWRCPVAYQASSQNLPGPLHLSQLP